MEEINKVIVRQQPKLTGQIGNTLIYVDPDLENKNINITENGTYTITADDNYDALGTVEIKADVASVANIFTQESEPNVKKGIWFQDNNLDYNDIVVTDEALKSNTWYTGGEFGELPIAFPHGNCARVGDYIYIFGSLTKSTCYKYNIKNLSFETIATPPIKGRASLVVAHGTDIYVFGGYAGQYGFSASRVAYKYDTVANKYTSLANMPPAWMHVSGAIVGDTVYIMSGNDSNGSYGDVGAYKYDILTNTYTQLSDRPDSYSMSAGCAAVGTDVYVLGGEAVGQTKRIFKYDTLNDTYTICNATLPEVGDGDAVAIGTDIYFFYNATPTVAKYDTTNDTCEIVEKWTQVGDIKNATILKVDNKVYRLGGAPYSDANKEIFNIDVLVMDGFEHDKNAAVIIQKDGVGKMATELSTVKGAVNQLLYTFDDAFYYSVDNGLHTTIPTYYGDGNQWIKFKN